MKLNNRTKPKHLKEKRITLYFIKHATVGKTEMCASFTEDCEVSPILAGSTTYRLQSLNILTQVNMIRGANTIGSTDSEVGVYKFSKKQELPQNSRRYETDMQQVPDSGRPNIGCHRIKFSYHGDLTPGFVHPCRDLYCTMWKK